MPTTPPILVTIRDAAAMFATGEKRLRALAQAGDVRGFVDQGDGKGTVKVWVNSLVEYFEGMEKAEKLAVEIAIRRVRR